MSRYCGSNVERTILDGPVGSGKSATLLLILNHLICARKENAESNNYDVLLYFPRMSRWIAGYYPYYHVNTVYEQPELAKDILKLTRLLNPHLLASGQPPREASTSDTENVITDLSELLGELSRRKVLILADEVNALFSPLSYRDVDSKQLSFDRMPVLQLIRDFILDHRHSLLGATCNSKPELSILDLKGPLQLNHEEKLTYFNAKEIRPLLSYYQSLGHVAGNPINDRYAQKIQFVSGGCGNKILPALQYDQVYQRS